MYLDVAQTAAALARLRETAARCDRPPGLGELEITVTPPGPVDLQTAQRYAELGVHRLLIQSDAEDGSGVEEFIELAGTKLIGRV